MRDSWEIKRTRGGKTPIAQLKHLIISHYFLSYSMYSATPTVLYIDKNDWKLDWIEYFKSIFSSDIMTWALEIRYILHSSFFIFHFSFFILHSSFFFLHSTIFILHSLILYPSSFILHYIWLPEWTATAFKPKHHKRVFCLFRLQIGLI